MAVRPIVTYPSKILRQKCRPVVWEDIEDPEVGGTMFLCLEIAMRDMEDTLEESDRGAALAANQVGIDMRMFVTNQGLTGRDDDPVVRAIPPVIINPQIVWKSPEQDWLQEGCLSFPGFSVDVKRHRRVRVSYDTILRVDGKWEREHVIGNYQGFWAQVFQHEIEHLDGKLFVDSLPERRRIEIANQIMKAKK